MGTAAISQGGLTVALAAVLAVAYIVAGVRGRDSACPRSRGSGASDRRGGGDGQ